jgi:hypothetical protein
MGQVVWLARKLEGAIDEERHMQDSNYDLLHLALGGALLGGAWLWGVVSDFRTWLVICAVWGFYQIERSVYQLRQKLDATAEKVQHLDHWIQRASDAEDGELSIAQPRVWTFTFNFSAKYVEQLLSQLGLEYSFRSQHPQGGVTTKEVPKQFKFEQYPHRIRCHRWLVTLGDDGKSDGSQPTYDWFDLTSHSTLWEYWFKEHTLLDDTPEYLMHISVAWNDTMEKRRYPYLACSLVKREHQDHMRKEIEKTLFHVPLDPVCLGKERHVLPEEDGKIYYGIGGIDDSFERRVWHCQSHTGDGFKWGWFLTLR